MLRGSRRGFRAQIFAYIYAPLKLAGTVRRVPPARHGREVALAKGSRCGQGVAPWARRGCGREGPAMAMGWQLNGGMGANSPLSGHLGRVSREGSKSREFRTANPGAPPQRREAKIPRISSPARSRTATAANRPLVRFHQYDERNVQGKSNGGLYAPRRATAAPSPYPLPRRGEGVEGIPLPQRGEGVILRPAATLSQPLPGRERSWRPLAPTLSHKGERVQEARTPPNHPLSRCRPNYPTFRKNDNRPVSTHSTT